jgi:hypothetical protein
MKVMLAFLLAFSFSAKAAVDLSILAHHDGKKGEGLSAIEPGNHFCGVKVNKEKNKLSIIQLNLMYTHIYILGDEVEKLVQTKKETVLETEEVEPVVPYFCGEWYATRNFTVKAKITDSEVAISYRYYCGPIRHVDTYTCEYK